MTINVTIPNVNNVRKNISKYRIYETIEFIIMKLLHKIVMTFLYLISEKIDTFIYIFFINIYQKFFTLHLSNLLPLFYSTYIQIIFQL